MAVLVVAAIGVGVVVVAGRASAPDRSANAEVTRTVDEGIPTTAVPSTTAPTTIAGATTAPAATLPEGEFPEDAVPAVPDDGLPDVTHADVVEGLAFLFRRELAVCFADELFATADQATINVVARAVDLDELTSDQQRLVGRTWETCFRSVGPP